MLNYVTLPYFIITINETTCHESRFLLNFILYIYIACCA